MHTVFLLASGRRDGNAELLARHAAAALPDDGEQTWLRISDYPLEPFVDHRRAADYASLTLGPNARRLFDATVAADLLVFATPVYWYSLPAAAKLYLDHWSTWLRVPDLRFRERVADRTSVTVLATMAGDDAAEARPLTESVRLSAAYLGMPYRGAIVATGANLAGDVLCDKDSLAAARALLAEATRAGREADARHI